MSPSGIKDTVGDGMMRWAGVDYGTFDRGCMQSEMPKGEGSLRGTRARLVGQLRLGNVCTGIKRTVRTLRSCVKMVWG